MEFGRVDVRVFLEPTQEALTDAFVERICAFIGFDLAAHRAQYPGEPLRTNRYSLMIGTAEGFDGTIRVMNAAVEAKKDAKALFERIVEGLSEEDRAFLRGTVPTRVDEEGHCYVRLDKLAFLEDKLVLVDHGQCVRFDFNILTYPRSQESAIAFVDAEVARLS